MAKILLVDDSEVARMEVRKHLVSGGHTVVDTDSAVHALTLLGSDTDFQLVIADFNMPALNGIELAQKTHQVVGLEALPFVLVSAQNISAFRNEAKAAGIKALLYKPVPRESLLEVVNKLI